MDVPGKPRSPRTTRIKAAKALKKLPTGLLLKKKAECDVKALRIVEQMIEPAIDVKWLLQNLGQINRTHMDDIVEERSIVKLCGYPLCDNPLKKVAQKQYQISTLRNKVYDISRVKNFCSYRCYTATEYLMEQMLTSPLWAREDADLPKFHILPKSQSRSQSPPGVEVDLTGVKLPDDADDQPDDEAAKMASEKKTSQHNSSEKEATTDGPGEKSDRNTNKVAVNKIDTVKDTQEKGMHENQNLCPKNTVTMTIPQNETKMQSLTASNKEKIEETRNEERPRDVEKSDVKERVGIDTIRVSKKEENKPQDERDRKPADSPSLLENENKASTKHSTNSAPILESAQKVSSEKRKTDRRKARESEKKEISFEKLTTRVESSLKEWITEETICLLHGEETEKRKILENVSRQEKYAVLCKKLNHLQLEEERNESERISELKPAPEFSALQDEAKGLELKVRAFFDGRTVIDRNAEKATDSTKPEEKEPDVAQLPLLDNHAPKALRRRIFLDKLNKVLPDLLRALVGTGQNSSTQYSYTSERRATVQALVSTFSLSATNIIFKTAEWTLVALIIIKLLSFMDTRIKYLLSSKQASMYTSMILMSYKLESNYLETLIVPVRSPSNEIVEEDS